MAPTSSSLEQAIEGLQRMLEKSSKGKSKRRHKHTDETSSESDPSTASSTSSEESSCDEQSSSSDAESLQYPTKNRNYKKQSQKRGKRRRGSDDLDNIQNLTAQLTLLQKQLKKQSRKSKRSNPPAEDIYEQPVSETNDTPPLVQDSPQANPLTVDDAVKALLTALGHQQVDQTEEEPAKRGTKVEFKRVDQVWDNEIHNYKLQETVGTDGQMNTWDQYTFTVRRRFDLEGKYLATFVDIKSKTLKACLKRILSDIKSANLFTDIPAIDPKLLFLYLDELRTLKKTLKVESKTATEKRERKEAASQLQHLNVLVKYLEDDFAETKRSLDPMLEAGTITYEYLWALFKPNTIAFSYTYSDDEEARAFRVESSMERCSFARGTWYSVEGKFLDYDGKSFGMATLFEDIPVFQGARKITSLPCYPLIHHRNADQMRVKLIERGKKFVSMQGMQYKSYRGMSYLKRKDKVLRVDVNGRIMVDPSVFRRINPNYPLSSVRMPDGDVIDLTEDPEYTNSLDTTTTGHGQMTPTSEDSERQKQFKFTQDKDGNPIMVELTEKVTKSNNVNLEDKSVEPIFAEEELLITSPVVLGFSFTEKLWLEFAISKIAEVQWNEGAFESLILPDSHKSIVKALVSSHAFHPSKSIDDIIAGKGKGLVAVLHGGPGLGKTLTVESIADLLRRPLYVVSVGDLGTDSATLERELQNILDVAHSWGAVLLLDEADVFLERRSVHDMQRNALVSIFLRQLEYFQGILFLTTNRVEVFDEAFVSRIHLSLRYNDLSTKAKKSVWKTFIGKVESSEGMKVQPISETSFDDLARRNVNGRQIKNIVRAAQALAISENADLSLSHIKTVIDVAQSFERDLKGGSGYEDAMRGYT